MKKEEKFQIIESLTEKLKTSDFFYLTDTSDLDVETINKLRRLCFKKEVSLQVVKNTLLRKAMDKSGKDFEPLFNVMKGATSIMFADTGNGPARLIKEFRKTSPKPIVKGAYIQEAYFIGDDQLEALSNIKSRDELLGDLIGLLQSPARNVISALQSGGSIIAGVVKTLSEREN
jgi:large subunit ribosomal protein L10